jgi:hypothetical protein
MPSSSIETFAQQCAQYCIKAGASSKAHAKMTAHIKQNVGDPATQAQVLARFNALVQMADQPPPPPAAAAAAMEVDDDDSAEETEEDSEADEESGDEIEIEDDGDEVFDIDRFASKGKFRQDEAEQAFHEWKRGRDKQKRPLHFYDDMGPGGPPEIPEDVFRRRQIELTQRLVDRDTCKLAEVDAELQDPTLTPRERKKLDQMRASLTRAIADRQAQMA